MASVRLRSGKGDFHIRLNPKTGERENTCLCIHNVDFSTGCLAQVPSRELLDIVTDNNGCYPKENLLSMREAFGKIPDDRCTYCYAMRHNSGRAIPSEVDEQTREDFERLKPEVVRLGKNTEVGYQLYRKQLIDFLNLCSEFGTKIILPTKVLEFDVKLVDLFKQVGGALHYSIGYNHLERGPVQQGFHNKWRVKQAEAYHDVGVNTVLTIVCDVTASIDENSRRGSAIKLTLDSSVPRRILPMRLTSGRLAKLVTGFYWEDLRNPQQLSLEDLNEYSPEMIERLRRVPYVKAGNNSFVANIYHPDFTEFMERDSSCGRIGDTERCDNCLVYVGQEENHPNFHFPANQLVKVSYDGKRTKNGDDKRYNPGKRVDPNRRKQVSMGI